YLRSSRHQHAFIDAPDALRQQLRDLKELQVQLRPAAIDIAAKHLRADTKRLAEKMLASAEKLVLESARAAEGDSQYRVCGDFRNGRYQAWLAAVEAFRAATR